MAVQFNHTTVSSRDRRASAAFLTEMLGLPGGRGDYFEDPNGHLLEVITRPYGSGGWNP
jgi:hypothetical protein